MGTTNPSTNCFHIAASVAMVLKSTGSNIMTDTSCIANCDLISATFCGVTLRWSSNKQLLTAAWATKTLTIFSFRPLICYMFSSFATSHEDTSNVLLVLEIPEVSWLQRFGICYAW